MKTFLWLFLLSSFEIFISSETGSPTVDENYFWFDGTHWLNEKQFDEEYKYVYEYYLQGNGPYEVIKSKWLKGTAFDDKYKFDCNDPLGSGTYGYVCSGISKVTSEPVVIKFLKSNMHPAYIEEEFIIYREIKKTLKEKFNVNSPMEKNIPDMLDEGVYNSSRVMVLTRLGRNMYDCKGHRSSDVLPWTKLNRFAEDAITGLEALHDVGYIHRDLKPDNFAEGKNNTSNFYMFDFSLATKYEESNGTHKPVIDEERKYYPEWFGPRNDIQYKTTSRRDDMEALGYVIFYLGSTRLTWVEWKQKSKSLFKKMQNRCKTFMLDLFRSDRKKKQKQMEIEKQEMENEKMKKEEQLHKEISLKNQFWNESNVEETCREMGITDESTQIALGKYIVELSKLFSNDTTEDAVLHTQRPRYDEFKKCFDVTLEEVEQLKKKRKFMKFKLPRFSSK